MAEINLQMANTESLASLAEKQRRGFSVMRSAHVGNARAYNLAFADAGVAMLLVDHTVTGVDKNYVPEAIIRGGDQWPIAELGQLSFRALTTVDDGRVRYLDEFHAAGLRAAFPNTPIETNTEYLRKNEAIVGEIAKIAVATIPELFRRVVVADEPTSIDSPPLAQRLTNRGNILQLADDPRREQGVLLPNEVDILANFVIELIASGRDAQYHVSGPDMVKYMTRPKSESDRRTPLEIVNTLYSALMSNASFASQLPGILAVHLIPGTAAKFATTTKRADDLDTLLAGVEETKAGLSQLNKERGQFFKSSGSKDASMRRGFIAAADSKRAEIAALFKQATMQCPDLLVGPKEAPFMSQYDVIDEDGLYIPDAIRMATMAELVELDRDIQNLQRGAP